MKESFIFYRSFFEASKALNDEQKLQFFNAIITYGLDKEETTSEPLVNAMYLLVKPQLMANHKRYEDGAKGGRPSSKKKTSKTTGSKNKKPNVNDNVNEKENEKDNVNVKKPTFEQVDKYIKESLYEYDLDSKKIFHYYDDADWFDAKGNKVKNWKQKIRGVWCKEENKKSNNQPSFDYKQGLSR